VYLLMTESKSRKSPLCDLAHRNTKNAVVNLHGGQQQIPATSRDQKRRFSSGKEEPTMHQKPNAGTLVP